MIQKYTTNISFSSSSGDKNSRFSVVMFIKKNKIQLSTFKDQIGFLQGFQGRSLSFRRWQRSVWQMASRVLTRSFQVGWLKVTVLEEVETATRLGIKCWFFDAGLSTCDSILEMLFPFSSLHMSLRHWVFMKRFSHSTRMPYTGNLHRKKILRF